MQYRVLTGMTDRPNAVVAIAAPMTGIDEAQSALVRTLVAVGALVMAALLVIAWIVIRQGLLPLERIARTAGDIAAGDLSHRAGVPHDDTEVGRLGTAFDAMLDQIEASFREQEQALAAVARSEERLRRFAADASHELRTPLTAIRGYADLYRAGGLAEPGAMDQAMARIGSEGRRMSTLVEDLLLLARLDEGRPVRRDAVDLSRIVDDAVADLRALEPSRDGHGGGRAGGGRRGRRGPPAPGGRQPARERPGPRRRAVAGRGAAADAARRGHRPSCASSTTARASTRPTRRTCSTASTARIPAGRASAAGRGLGLSIVASIVGAHGGRLWHERTTNGGATFVVTLGLHEPTAESQVVPGSQSAEAD